jgi:hypothetical protein
MSPIATSLITLACIMGGMLFGMFLRTLLPKHHLTDDSKDVIKMGTGMVATMAALVLGLVVASAKGTFDTLNSGVRQAGTKIIQLDRTMASYGPETREARDVLRRGVTTAMERIWPADKKAIAVEKVGHSGVAIGELEEKLRKLSPRNDDQRGLQSRALQISGEFTDAISQIILRPVHLSQYDGDRHLAGLRDVGCECTLPDTGTGSALRGNHQDFQRSPAKRACTSRPVDRMFSISCRHLKQTESLS